MAHIVAADFNPPMNNEALLLNSVGMVHLSHLYAPFLRNSIKMGEMGSRGLKSTATISAIPTGFFMKTPCSVRCG